MNARSTYIEALSLIAARYAHNPVIRTAPVHWFPAGHHVSPSCARRSSRKTDFLRDDISSLGMTHINIDRAVYPGAT